MRIKLRKADGTCGVFNKKVLYILPRASLLAQTVKNPPANAGDLGLISLGQEDPLEKGMVTHSSVLAWSVPWTEEPGGLQSLGLQRVA